MKMWRAVPFFKGSFWFSAFSRQLVKNKLQAIKRRSIYFRSDIKCCVANEDVLVSTVNLSTLRF